MSTVARFKGSRERGLTLIELMIAMVLGLVLIGSVGSVVIANGQANRTNTALGEIQDSARTAFELLARDVRQAGATGCGNFADQVATPNLSDPVAAIGWSGIRGYPAGTATPGSVIGNRIAGTDAVLVQGISGGGFLLTDVDSHPTEFDSENAPIAWERSYVFRAPQNAVTEGDLLMACNSGGAVIFEAENVSADNNTITAWDLTGTSFFDTGADNGMLAPLNSTIWYIGNNGRPAEGGRSLYRRQLGSNAEEIIPGVNNMVIGYRDGESVNFVSDPGNWEGVSAVEITLTLVSTDARVSVDDGRLQRSFTTLIGLRNPRQ